MAKLLASYPKLLNDMLETPPDAKGVWLIKPDGYVAATAPAANLSSISDVLTRMSACASRAGLAWRNMTMFSVIFEVRPNKANWDDYLGNAKMLRPELEKVDGFVDNIRYKSLTRDGWILSLSNWRDEKSLVRWRTHTRHHEVQQKGRDEILADYHLRVGQITADNHLPVGCALIEQRLDETEVGEGTAITLINAASPSDFRETNDPDDLAKQLGLEPWAMASVSWDLFDAVLTSGDLILLISWKHDAAARSYVSALAARAAERVRHVRVVRDYGKYDRREAPQYYADAEGATTVHA